MKAEHLPATEPDPMTGKGGRQYPAVRFVWEIADAAHHGKTVNTDTPVSSGPKSRFYGVVAWLYGRNLAPGEPYDLSQWVGKQYLVTLGSRPGRTWVEVTNAMLLPGQ